MRVLVPFGQLREATVCNAASAPSEPSTPISNLGGLEDSVGRPRPIRTEHRAAPTTVCETLPRRKRPTAEWPCEPTTIRSAFQIAALARTQDAGEPQPV